MPSIALEIVKRDLEVKLREVGDGNIPLFKKNKKKITKCLTLAARTGPSSAKAASDVLARLWEHRSRLFLLCALASTPTKLGRLDEAGCVRLEQWWDAQEQPLGLEATFQELITLGRSEPDLREFTDRYGYLASQDNLLEIGVGLEWLNNG